MLYNQNLCITQTFSDADGRDTVREVVVGQSLTNHSLLTLLPFGRVAVSLDGFLCILVENNLFVLIFGRNVVSVVEHLVRKVLKVRGRFIVFSSKNCKFPHFLSKVCFPLLIGQTLSLNVFEKVFLTGSQARLIIDVVLKRIKNLRELGGQTTTATEGLNTLFHFRDTL